MLTEQDLIDYMIWSGYVSQSVKAMRPKLARGVRWLTDMGVTRSPLHLELSAYSRELALSHNLINHWLYTTRNAHDPVVEHAHRDLLAQMGAPVRPYKGPKPKR